MNKRVLRLFVILIIMGLVRSLLGLLEKHIDFHFALALIAIFGVAGSLYLQFNEANDEFDTLNASMYSVVRSQKTMDDRENAVLNYQLDKLENELDALILN